MLQVIRMNNYTETKLHVFVHVLLNKLRKDIGADIFLSGKKIISIPKS